MKKTVLGTLLLLASSLLLAASSLSSKQFFSSVLWDMNGRQVALEGLRGKPVVVSFWASWCASCSEEVKDLNMFKAEQQGRTQVVGIAVEENLGAIRQFAKSNNMTYISLVSGAMSSSLMKSVGNENGLVPYTVVIDKSGYVVARKFGHIKKEELDAILKNG